GLKSLMEVFDRFCLDWQNRVHLAVVLLSGISTAMAEHGNDYWSLSQPNYLAAKKLLDATVIRHEAIASNLANLETPNYKRLDVAPSFQTELRQAMSSPGASQLSGVQPHLAVDSDAVANTRDGNTVQLETE